MDQLLPAKDCKVLLSTAGWREQEHLAGPVTLPPYAVCILEAVLALGWGGAPPFRVGQSHREKLISVPGARNRKDRFDAL